MAVDLKVNIEVKGKQTLAGYLKGNDYRDTFFFYDKKYIEEVGKQISISLPIQQDAFSIEKTRIFFESLLPEGFSRKAVAQWIKSKEEDYIAILKALGRECLGAILITDDKEEIESSYQLLELSEIKALAEEGATKSTQMLINTHLSLTGASGKVGLYYDRECDKWYKPLGLCASTHIVKQSHVRLSQLVVNEQICQLTAKNLGINVPESFIINLGDGSDGSLLFATKRYDRVLSNKTKDNLKVPYRLHQEDFCQALGIASGDKYELENEGRLSKIFDLIKAYSARPMDDMAELWRRIVFNVLIGNTDAHLKNYSFVYNEMLSGARLSPAYDLISTYIYNTSPKMSMYIGRKKDIKDLSRDCFKEAAKDIGFGMKRAMEEFDRIYDLLPQALDRAGDCISKQGIKGTDEMVGRIKTIKDLTKYRSKNG